MSLPVKIILVLSTIMQDGEIVHKAFIRMSFCAKLTILPPHLVDASFLVFF